MKALLEILSDGKFHSGEALGKSLGVTRAAVWKKLKSLQSLGLRLDSVPGKGYRVQKGVELLEKQKITKELRSGFADSLEMDFFVTIPSSNDVAMSKARSGIKKNYFCFTEHQSLGRGRRGRTWVSPLGNNLYFSTLWTFYNGIAGLEGLSLAVGLTVVKGLEQLGVQQLALKWPNDVLLAGKKAAGVLLEVMGDPAGECQVIIGIGINIDLPTTSEAEKEINQSIAAVSQYTPNKVTRNKLAAVLIGKLSEMLTIFQQEGFGYFLNDWQNYDAFFEQPVNIIHGQQNIPGVAKGVDVSGGIKVLTADGLVVYKGGEVSLRRRIESYG
ncbi:bifunctional biotin--[acetyl-CoA-carboxylase] ligase/biotin operon repressor BirA [Zooshikella sp. RANM57]|uniref:bifunctional biotin--[acetyl-CoA-carboxylase] ligase/biotin operon repressor BirA n=1 Tax=Zooshikella sp. RANM57 TaxID=3425863 RepID=UPI003D6FD262